MSEKKEEKKACRFEVWIDEDGQVDARADDKCSSEQLRRMIDRFASSRTSLRYPNLQDNLPEHLLTGLIGAADAQISLERTMSRAREHAEGVRYKMELEAMAFGTKKTSPEDKRKKM